MFKKSLLLLYLILFAGCSKSVFHTNKGYWKMYKKDNPGAETEFLSALIKEPGNVQARYNLAINNVQLEQLKNSLTELEAIEKMYENHEGKKNSRELFEVYFAKGFVLSMIQDVDGALESYQKALEIDKDSKKVKINIELLTSQQQGDGKGKGSSDDKNGKKDKSKKGEKGDESDEQKGSGDEDKNKDIQGEDKNSLKRKNLSKEEIEQILKEIKDQESKVRAKESKKNDEAGGGDDDKSW